MKSVRNSALAVMAIALLTSIMMTLSTHTTLAQEVEPASVDLAAVSHQLSLELQTTAEPVSFLVILKDQLTPDGLETGYALSASSSDSITREERIATSYHELTKHAKQTQASLQTWLDNQSIAYRPFYIVNMIEVTGDAALADALRRRPEVDRLVGNPQINQQHSSMAPDGRSSLYAPWFNRLALPAAQSQDLPYGLSDTDADEVWKLGYTGEGITVASQDTGVLWDHPALQPRYRGWSNSESPAQHVYNWFDAWGLDRRPARCAADAQVPCDDHGHGTHTVGTMIGNGTAAEVQVGMAPGADWIGCRNMRNGIGTPTSYTSCFEFFLAPYPQGGDPFEDGRPELAPHIVNNSWGCPPSEGCDADSLKQIVETVRAAGIFVVASAGNNGYAGCSSVVDPIAIYDGTFSVGAHSATGAIASFSSRGPVNIDGSGHLKPDISAPGVGVYSTTLYDGYGTSSGTSMASPHVAGATALLWSAVPALIGQIDLTEQVLIKSATPVSNAQCDINDARLVPNNVFGYGRLSALQAIQLAQHPVEVTVQVTQIPGQRTAEIPLPGIGISLTDQLTGYVYETVTDAGGGAVFPKVFAGGYQLQASGDDGPLVSVGLEFEQDVVRQENDVVQDGTRLRYQISGNQENVLRLFWPIIQNSR